MKSLVRIKDTDPTPIPSPTGAGSHRVQRISGHPAVGMFTLYLSALKGQ